MKTTFTNVLFVIFACLFISCSSDDSTATPQNEEVLETDVLLPDYFPVSTDNYWSYRVVGGGLNSIDSLYVNSINGDSFTLDVTSADVQSGFMNTILTDGVLTKQGTALTLDSSIDFNLGLLNNDVINFEGLVLFDTARPIGDVLTTITGSYQDDLFGNPLTVNYTLSSTHIGELDSLTFDQIPYPIVEVVDIILEISVSIEVEVDGVPTTALLLEPQNILKIQTYYSADIGLVKSGTIYGYSLNYPTLVLLHSLDIDWIIEPNDNNVILEEMRAHSVVD
jgi:hypothetical protein